MHPAMLDLDGIRLEAAWWGAPAGAFPVLVLLHEGLGSVGLWRDFPARLAEATGAPVFAWSRQGYGRSAPAALPRPLDYMRIEAETVLPRVLDAAAIGAAVLVGHSDGGSIAAIAGASGDPRLRGLALIAPHFVTEPAGLAAIAATRAAYAGGSLRARLGRHHDDPDNAFFGWADAWLDPCFPAAFDLTPFLPRIAVPTLVIQGRDDPYGSDLHARLADRLIPSGARIAMVPAAHAPHQEAPAETLAALTDFVRPLLPETQDAD
ncbi:MAG: alpha/beta fold hydrolase [Rhodospirillales bacterium]|nr:alpha/beta fold hydrolase [Rhodospirillales bacterium]